MSTYSDLTNIIKNGRTDERPDEGDRVGDQFFDTQLDIMFYWDGTLWRRAGGSLDMLPTSPENAWALNSGFQGFYGVFPGPAAYGDHQYLAVSNFDKINVSYTFMLDTRDSSDDLILSIIDSGESVVETTGPAASGTIHYIEDVSGGDYLILDVQNTSSGTKNKWKVLYSLEDIGDNGYGVDREDAIARSTWLGVDTERTDELPWATAEIWWKISTGIGTTYDLWCKSNTIGWGARVNIFHGVGADIEIGSAAVNYGDPYESVIHIDSCPATAVYVQIISNHFSDNYVYQGGTTIDMVTGGA